MKKTLSIIAAGLLLAGCSNTPPETMEFLSKEVWDNYLKETDLVCENNEWVPHPFTGTYAQANCYDENGDRIGRIMVDSRADSANYVDKVIYEGWEIPALLQADYWVVQCPTVERCEDWQSKMGGEILLYPDYSPMPV